MTVDGEHVGSIRASRATRSGNAAACRTASENDGPRYVTRIDGATKTIVIGRAADLYTTTLTAKDVSLLRPERFSERGEHPRPSDDAVSLAPGRRARAFRCFRRRATVRFSAPERAVAPGQLIALYDLHSGEVLGGATIRSSA